MAVTRRPVVAIVAAALGAVVLAAVVVVSRGPARNTTGLANQRPAKLPSGEAPKPEVIALPDGTRLTCPQGMEPEVMLDEAAFAPQLAGGTSLEPGSYHLKLRGTVSNETTEPIHVISVAVVVGDVKWGADITVATPISPHDSTPLVVEGAYQSGRAQPANVHTHLTWEWQAPALRPCGSVGLIGEH